MVSITPVGLAAVVSCTVATSPSSTNWRAQSTSPFGSRPVSHVVSSMQWPPMPPRLLNASTDASAASTWSMSDSTGDSNTVMIPIGYGVRLSSHGPSSVRSPERSMSAASSAPPSSADAPSPPESSVQAPTTSASVQVHAANHFRFCITPPNCLYL